jgi:hypothetical protein
VCTYRLDLKDEFDLGKVDVFLLPLDLGVDLCGLFRDLDRCVEESGFRFRVRKIAGALFKSKSKLKSTLMLKFQ